MRSEVALPAVALLLCSLASCNGSEQSLEPNGVQRAQLPDEQRQAQDAQTARPAQRDAAFFANPDYSEKQFDYLMARLAELPEADRACVENDLSESFEERMAACEASQQWTFLCGGCNRISDSIMYDPAAMVGAMQLCGIDFALPKWE